MKAALVMKPGATPVYGDFAEPVAGPGRVRVSVTAAALSHLAKSRASGEHYSADGRYPLVPGVDGTGTLDDGTRVYFALPEAPFGSMAERCVVDETRCIPLPPGLDDDVAAAIAIPGMSSWAAFVERAKLVAGETVLINGATGTSGRLAVQVAKTLGASRVIATGRDREALNALLAIGADATIALVQDDAALDRELQAHFREGIAVVLDYLWGPSAERVLAAAARAAPDTVPVRFVQIGSILAPTIALPSAVLRSTAIEMMGSGIGSVPLPRILDAIRHLFEAAVSRGFAIDVSRVPLSEVASHWNVGERGVRTVFRPRA